MPDAAEGVHGLAAAEFVTAHGVGGGLWGASETSTATASEPKGRPLAGTLAQNQKNSESWDRRIGHSERALACWREDRDATLGMHPSRRYASGRFCGDQASAAA